MREVRGVGVERGVGVLRHRRSVPFSCSHPIPPPQEQISKDYEPVACRLRNKATIEENNNPRYGYGKKYYQGRIGKICFGWDMMGQLERVKDIMETNGIKPIMDKVGPEDIDLCMYILGGDIHLLLRRDNEDHLKDPRVDEIVHRLIQAGITLEVVAGFSQALAMIDAITSACLRPQDTLGCLARKVHTFEGSVRAIMPFDAKNFLTLARGNSGGAINHDKSSIARDAFAVSTVICRPLMRKLLANQARDRRVKLNELRASPSASPTAVKKATRLAEEADGYRLGDTTAPFNANGKCFTVDDGRYLDLFQFVGERCFGLSNWGPNICRTWHITMISADAVSEGMAIDDPDLFAQCALARHGTSSRVKYYDVAKEQAVTKTPFGKAHAGLLQSARHQRKLCSSETSSQSSDSSSVSKPSMSGSKRRVDGGDGKARGKKAKSRGKGVKAIPQLFLEEEESEMLLGQMRDLAKSVIDEIVPTKNGMEPTHPKYGKMGAKSLELYCKRQNGKVCVLYDDRLVPIFKERDPELTTKFYGAFPTVEFSKGRFGTSWPDWWTRFPKAKSSGTEGTEPTGSESGDAESGNAESGNAESGDAESVNLSPVRSGEERALSVTQRATAVCTDQGDSGSGSD